MALVTLRSYRDPIDAELAKSRLESEGIPAVIADQHIVAMQWLYSVAIGGVRVQVEEEDLARARDVLSRDDSADLESIPESQGPPTERDRCAVCGSSEIQPSRLYRVAAAISLLSTIPIPIGRNRLVCRTCGHTWTQHPDRDVEIPRETLEAERAVYEHRPHPEITAIAVALVGLLAVWLLVRAC